MHHPRSLTSPLMVALVAFGLSSAAASSDKPAPYCGTERWRGLIQEAEIQTRTEAAWIDAVMRVESAGCETVDGKPITSKAGAIGLMQLMPATWAEMRERLHLGADPSDPRDNILAGSEWLHELYKRYGPAGFLAAYHAGPERYESFLHQRRALPDETLIYIARVNETFLNANSENAQASPTVLSTRGPFVRSREPVAPSEALLIRTPFVMLTPRGRIMPDDNSTKHTQSLADRKARQRTTKSYNSVMGTPSRPPPESTSATAAPPLSSPNCQTPDCTPSTADVQPIGPATEGIHGSDAPQEPEAR